MRVKVSKKIVGALSNIFCNLGVDDSPYIVSGSGQEGYGSIIMGPTDKIIEEGDLFIIDTGSVFDSYYCDFDRNYAFGSISDEAKKAYRVTYEATEAGFNAAQVGNTTSDIFNAMNDVLQKGGALGNTVGRLRPWFRHAANRMALQYAD